MPNSQAQSADEWAGDAPLSASPAASEPLAGRFAMISDIGRQREQNEDSAFGLLQQRISDAGAQALGLFILADGMGGQAAGERASAVAVQAAGECLLREVFLPLLDPTGLRWSGVPINEAIGHAFEAANAGVLDAAPGGATTLTLVIMIGRRLYVGHAGDCRLYLLRDGALRALTRDHSILSRLIELGQASESEGRAADQDPRRHTLYRAVGQAEGAEYDLLSFTLEAGDGLLLCCDGLWGTVSDAEMAHVLTQAGSPAEACRQLVDLANRSGGPDNITAIVIPPAGQA
jgi:serine/threonine protein phosphatase PrpC